MVKEKLQEDKIIREEEEEEVIGVKGGDIREGGEDRGRRAVVI